MFLLYWAGQCPPAVLCRSMPVPARYKRKGRWLGSTKRLSITIYANESLYLLRPFRRTPSLCYTMRTEPACIFHDDKSFPANTAFTVYTECLLAGAIFSLYWAGRCLPAVLCKSMLVPAQYKRKNTGRANGMLPLQSVVIRLRCP